CRVLHDGGFHGRLVGGPVAPVPRAAGLPQWLRHRPQTRQGREAGVDSGLPRALQEDARAAPSASAPPVLPAQGFRAADAVVAAPRKAPPAIPATTPDGSGR